MTQNDDPQRPWEPSRKGWKDVLQEYRRHPMFWWLLFETVIVIVGGILLFINTRRFGV